jgi:hypothetical protein
MGTSNKIVESIKTDAKEEIIAGNGNTAELLLEYESGSGETRHSVIEFHMTTTGSLFGRCEGVFDFDFFDTYNVTKWYSMKKILKHLQ